MKTIIMAQTLMFMPTQGKEVADAFNKKMEIETRPFTQKRTESGVVYNIREEV